MTQNEFWRYRVISGFLDCHVWPALKLLALLVGNTLDFLEDNPDTLDRYLNTLVADVRDFIQNAT